MQTEAVKAGYHETDYGKYSGTIEQGFRRKEAQHPTN